MNNKNLHEIEKVIRSLPPTNTVDTQTLDRLIVELEEVDSVYLALEYFYSEELEEPVSASTIDQYLQNLWKDGKLVKIGKTSYGDDIYYSLESLSNALEPETIEQGTLSQITRADHGWILDRSHSVYKNWSMDTDIYQFDSMFFGEIYCCEAFLKNFCEQSWNMETAEIPAEELQGSGKVYRTSNFLIVVPVQEYTPGDVSKKRNPIRFQ